MNNLLIDIGSTFIKWALYCDSNKQKSPVSSLPFPAPGRSDPPYFEIGAEEIYQAILAIIAKAGRIGRVCFSVQMHGYILGDEHGQAITPYISWQDERASLQVDGLSYTDRFPYPVTPQSGSSLKANLPAVSLFAMSSLAPNVFRQARMFFTLGSYLVFRLTGVNATHITDAAASGFYIARTAQPSDLQIGPISLPVAIPDFIPAGYQDNLAIFAPVGDQQAAVMGSGLDVDSCLLNLGTAGQLCTLSEQPLYGDFESRPYFHAQTLCTVTHLPGGRDMLRLRGSQDLPVILANAYRQAMIRLPKRKRLLVVGGAAHFHRILIDQVCRKLDRPFEIRTGSDTLDGLITLLSRRDE